MKVYQKFLAATVTAALVTTAATPVFAYNDATGHYKEAVAYVTKQGIAQGFSSTEFGVNANITRGDAAVMIANALNISTSNASTSPFTDLNSRVKNAVNALYSEGIINGKTKTTFAPDDQITRAEMAKLIANAYELDAGGTEHSFKDVNKNWSTYINALLHNGVTQGKTSTNFGAADALTRGEFAIFLYRLKEHNVEQFEPDTEAPVFVYEGKTLFNIAYNSTFTVPMVTAKDNVDDEVEVIMTIINEKGAVIENIDTKQPGVYKITYNAVDKAGNRADELIITVVVMKDDSVWVPNPPVDPTPPSEIEIEGELFSGTAGNIKIYNTSVKVSGNNLSSLQYAEVRGDLTIEGGSKERFDLLNLRITGDLIIVGVDSKNVSFNDVEVDGDISI